MLQGILFRHFTVLTPVPSDGIVVHQDCYVSVLGSNIVYCGLSEDTARSVLPAEIEILDGFGRLLMPALANAHGHIAMTLMRNSADDLNLHDWLFNVIFPREKRLTPDIVYQGTLLGICEMIRSGTGAAADMYYHSESVLRAVTESGMRGNICCEGKGISASTGKTEVLPADLESFFRQSERAANGRIRASLMVHSIYLYEESLYSELAAMAREIGCFIQVHISETQREVDECIAKYGMRPPAKLAQAGILDGPVIAAHCVHLNDEDRAILARPNLLAVHNPSSNMKLGSGLADVPAMLRAGMRVGLGTDGAASNNSLDMFKEMRLTSFIAKAAYCDASVLKAAEVIRMATCDGMAGLGFPESGCISAGYAADLQIIDINRPAMIPLGDPGAALVYCGDGSFVESLMIDGRFLMYKNQIQTLDEEKIMADSVFVAKQLID